MLAAHSESDSEEGSSAFEEPEPAESISGLLVSRDHSSRTPTADHLPGLSALLRVSRDVGAVLLGGAPSGGLDTSWAAAAGQSVADQLRAAASPGAVPAEVVGRLGGITSAGCRDVSSQYVWVPRISSVLTPGVGSDRVAGVMDDHERWGGALAASAGLTPVNR